MKLEECSTQFSIKTIFIMLHSFCRAYEKAGIFLAFIILQTDDEALLGIHIKKSLFEFRIH